MATIMRVGGGGGGEKQMYSVTLPKSQYYPHAAEWTQVSTQGIDDSLPAQAIGAQICANGYLWRFDALTVTQIDLSTGETVWQNTYTATTANTTYSSNVNYANTICTDGVNIYISYFSSEDDYPIYAFNTISRAMTKIATNGYHSNSAACYSKYHNAVFYFGSYSSSAVNKRAYKLDCDTLTITMLTEQPMITGSISSGWAWSDDDTGMLYFARRSSTVTTSNYYMYDPNSDAYTLLGDMPFLTMGLCYVPIGDNVCGFYGGSVIGFDPKTGKQWTEQTPAVLPTNDYPRYHLQVGVWENALYTMRASGLWKCELFTDPPEDAPIVAKIYKGQKFHSLTEWPIESKNITVTTEQQKATEDIEIRMYDYPQQGGQVLYIEG